MSIKAKILVVDDNIDDVEMYKMILESEGFEVITALDGTDAKERMKEEKPDLILLDVMMPEMDGFAFCSWIRSNEDYKDLPVVLLTGVAKHILDTKYPLDGVLRADADDYLEKPIKPEVLLDTVARLLK